MASEPSSRFGLGLLWIALSGALMVLPYPPFNAQWVAWWMLVPAIVALHFSGFWRKHAFLAGWLIGLISFGGQLWWIGHVTAPGTAVLVAYMALYPCLWFGVVVRWGLARAPLSVGANVALSLAAACWWVVLEWVRGWMLSGFPWNFVGVGLWQNAPLLQLAWVGGVLLLSWLVVFVNVMVVRLLVRVREDVRAERRRQPFWEGGLALAVVALAFGWGLRRTLDADEPHPRSLRIAAIQPNIPQSAYRAKMSRYEIMARHAYLSRLAAEQDPDLLIWPEATSGLDPQVDTLMSRVVEQVTRNADFYLLFGAQNTVLETYNAAYFWHPDGVDHEVYRKNRLVIFGEYVPFGDTFPILRDLVPSGVDFSAGSEPALFFVPTRKQEQPVRVAPLICFEDTLPNYVRRVTLQQPEVLVDLTNDNWFGESPGAEQHLANAVFRAAEHDMPLIRVANSGVTCVIDQRGRVREAIVSADDVNRRVGIEGVLATDVSWRPAVPGPYARWGDWIAGVAALGCVGWLLALRRWPA